MRRFVAACVLALAANVPAAAQPCPPATDAFATVTGGPFDRSITLDGGAYTVVEALEQLAARAHVRITYSPQLLPVRDTVCLAVGTRTLGAALGELFHASGVEAVAVAADHVVLVPPREVVPLDTLVVRVAAGATGRADDDDARAAAMALVAAGARTVTLDAAAIMLRSWSAAAGASGALLARFGRLHGGAGEAAYPRVVIDGIESASGTPLVGMAPALIERIELIRGAHAVALFGGDAITGIISIVTRQPRIGSGAARITVQNDVSFARSDYGADNIVQQRHAALANFGSPLRSLGISVSAGGGGGVVEGATARRVAAAAGARDVGRTTVLRAFASVAGEDGDVTLSPRLAALAGDAPATLIAGRRTAWQYTAGASAAWLPVAGWTHAATIGVDGYSLDGLPWETVPLSLPTDSAARQHGDARRLSLRLTSAGTVTPSDALELTLSLAAEHSRISQSSATALAWFFGEPRTGERLPTDTRVRPLAALTAATSPAPPARQQALEASAHTSGIGGQLTAALERRLFLTAGLRVEHEASAGDISRTFALPVAGLAVAGSAGAVRGRVHVAHARGAGQAAASAPMRERGRERPRLLAAAQPAYTTEAGADALLGERVMLQLTWFDRRATELTATLVRRPAATAPALDYELQSIGSVGSRGIELVGGVHLGPASLTGTVTRATSHLEARALGYTGELQPGDRLLAVPRHALSLAARYVVTRASATMTLTRTGDWVNYDWLALQRSLTTGELPATPVELRRYWRTYDGVTRLGGALTHELRPGLTLLLSGDNLLGRQLGEPDNLTVVPGRTWGIGMRTTF